MPIFLLLAILHTWPLASAPGTQSLNYNADTEQCEWAIAWIAHALPRDPLHVFDGNIFAPEPHVLTYTDPVLLPGLVSAPILWLGGSPVLAFNLLLLAGLTSTAWAGWFVVRQWTGSEGAALVAGALVAFNAHLLTRLPHIPAWSQWELPLVLYFADRIVDTPTGRDAVRLACLIVAIAATSLYSLAFAMVIVGIAGIAGVPRWRGLLVLGAATIAGGVAALPVLWPYVQMAGSGASRPLEMVAQFSATPAAYITSLARLHAGWTRRFYQDDVRVLFAGVVPLLLMPLGLAACWRARHRRRAVMLIVLAAAGVVLSLGPATSLYRLLYAWVLPLRGLRAAARFGYLFLIVVALAAGLGVAALEARIRHPRLRTGLAALVLIAVTIETWSGPLPVIPFHGVPAVYQLVRDVPGPVMLAEVPFYPPEGEFENGEYVLNATAHWRPLMNGHSGAIPDSYRRRAAAFWFFPQDWAIDAMHREGVTHVMVHLEKFTPSEVDEIEQMLRRRRDLQLLGSDTRGHRLYALLAR